MTLVPSRIVLTTFGSLGDLHPYLALAIGLADRGHSVTLATQESYRDKVEGAGVAFHPVGPDIADYGDEAALMARVMDKRHGPSFVIREMLVPHLRRTYDELSAVVAGADLFITHPMTLAAQLVAARHQDRTAWASVALAPSSFWSAYDPPVLSPLPALSRLRLLGPAFFRPVLGLMKRSVNSWVRPWHQLRRELGLLPTRRNPMFDGQFSPQMTLALFSPLLADPQPDWPPNTHVTGFLYYDRHGPAAGLPDELTRFLDAGEPPIVFTLGSSAVMDAGTFYTASMEAAWQLGRRAVLLVGRDPRNRPGGRLPDGVAAFEYAPYSELLPRAAATVHQGGVGTSAQALRSGRPMLVVPFGFDQPDNAARLVNLGVARTLARAKYAAGRAAAELASLLADARYAARSAVVGGQVRAENGLAAACAAVEAELSRHAAGVPVPSRPEL